MLFFIFFLVISFYFFPLVSIGFLSILILISNSFNFLFLFYNCSIMFVSLFFLLICIYQYFSFFFYTKPLFDCYDIFIATLFLANLELSKLFFFPNFSLVSVKSFIYFFDIFIQKGFIISVILLSGLYFFFDSSIHRFFYRKYFRFLTLIRKKFLYFFFSFKFLNVFFYYCSFLYIYCFYFYTLLKRFFFGYKVLLFEPNFERVNACLDLDGRGVIQVYYGSIKVCCISGRSLDFIISYLMKECILFPSSAFGELQKEVIVFLRSLSCAFVFYPGEDEFDITFPNGVLDLKKYFPSFESLRHFILLLNFIYIHFFYRNIVDRINFNFSFTLNGFAIKVIYCLFPSDLGYFLSKFRVLSFRSSYKALLLSFYSSIFCFFSSYLGFYPLFLYYVLFFIYFICGFQMKWSSCFALCFRLSIVLFCSFYLSIPSYILPFLLWVLFYNPFFIYIGKFFLFYFCLDTYVPEKS